MSKAPAYAEAPFNHLVVGLAKQTRTPVRVQWDTGPVGEPRAWLEVQPAGQNYRRVASLAIRVKGAAATTLWRSRTTKGPRRDSPRSLRHCVPCATLRSRP